MSSMFNFSEGKRKVGEKSGQYIWGDKKMFNERSLTSTELLMSLAILQLLSSFVEYGRWISDVLNNLWEERKDILCNHIFSCILVLKGRRKMHVELRPWLNIQGITMFCAVTISWAKLWFNLEYRFLSLNQSN